MGAAHRAPGREFMRLVTFAVFVLSLATGLPAAAFDLTGYWEGSWSCSEFYQGEKTKTVETDSTAQITSLGNGTFGAFIDGSLNARGIEIADASKPERGEIALIYCGADDDLANNENTEFARFKVSTSGERGSISGTSIWSAGPGHIATCKYKWTRVSTTNPGRTYTCP